MESLLGLAKLSGHKNAIKLLRRARDVLPHDVRPYMVLASLFKSAGKAKRGKGALRQGVAAVRRFAAQKGTTDTMPRNLHAALLADFGWESRESFQDGETALTTLREAHTIDPYSPTIAVMLGVVLAEAGFGEDAVKLVLELGARTNDLNEQYSRYAYEIRALVEADSLEKEL